MNDNSNLTSAMGLQQQVENALEGSSDVARYPIGVSVVGTSVSLTGEVGSAAAKAAAERVARGVSGVIDVTNELVVANRSDSDWGLLGRRRGRATDDGGADDAGVNGTVGFAALGGANLGIGGGVGGGASGIGGGIGAAGLGAGAALATEGAAGDLANDEGYTRGEDTEQARG